MAREGSLLVSIFYRGSHAACPPLMTLPASGTPPPSLDIKLEICGAWPQWGPSCHRCASAVLAEVPAPARCELCQQMSCCQSLRRSQLKAPQPPPPNTPQKQRPLDVAAKLVIDRCERPLVDACQRELKTEEERQLWMWKADTSLIGSEQNCRKCVAESATASMRSLGINHMGKNIGECNLGLKKIKCQNKS